jgi:tripartite-type tricarboxylate transporter receptor subunit TctC
MNIPSILSAMPQWKSGKLRALAVTGAKRSPVAPELPTMMEAGVKGYESATWYGVLAPAKTPRAIVSRVNGDIVAILNQPEVRDRMLREGAEPVGNSPEEFAAYMKSEIAKWGKVIRAAKIQAN